MKIAYVLNTFSVLGGLDRVISVKANYYAEQCGYEVYFITASQLDEQLSYPLSPKITHIDLGIDFNQQYRYPIVKRGYIYFSLMNRYKKELTKALNNLKADIVLTPINRDVDFLTSVKDGSRKIAEAHISKAHIRSLHLMRRKNFIYRIIASVWSRKLEQSISKFDELVVLTQSAASDWSKVRQSSVIPNPLPFNPTQISRCNNKKIISVGRLDEQKGYDRLIDAWAMISSKYPDWTISVFGEGNQEAMLRQKIEQKNIAQSFKLENPVKNIADKYLDSSVYVMSSRFEGFPMVLLEAMACGLPVVSFDCPDGPAEIIVDGSNGFLVENGDIRLLADKIAFLIGNEEARIKMGAKAKETAQLYTQDAIMNKWIDLFNSLKNRSN